MKLGLIGAKLGHTASPAIHSKLFSLLHLEGENTYSVLEMDRNDIPSELQRLQQEGYTGTNVTIPYKVEVISYLTGISREARAIGAVNTLHFTPEGIFGYNTDYGGFGRSLQHSGIEVKGKNVVVLGTGGAARAITQYLADQQAGTLTIISRHPQSTGDFETFAKALGAQITDYAALDSYEAGEVLVNCTPVGMFPHVDGCPVKESVIARFPAVVDIIYNPKNTQLLQIAARHGAKTLNGMYMLVAQAIGSEEIWMDRKIDFSIIEEIAKEMETYYG